METLSRLTELRLIPQLRPAKLEMTLPLLAALCSGGIGAAEFSMQIPFTPDALRSGCRLFPDFVLGAGDVTSPEDAEIAIQSGAHYLSSPGYSPTLAAICREQDVLYLPQCITPSELLEVKLNKLPAFGLFSPHLWGSDRLITELVTAVPGPAALACRIPYTEAEKMLNLPGITACTLTGLPVDSPSALVTACQALSRLTAEF